MKTRIKDYFDVSYGNSLSFAEMEEIADGIPFVSRTDKNNGISGIVKEIESIKPNPANTISVAVSGTILESFLQKESYYTGYHILILKPKLDFTDIELLFYCMCIRANNYKYSYGRQANKTLRDIVIPNRNEIPQWVYETEIKKPIKEAIIDKEIELNTDRWREFKVSNLFEIDKGKENTISNLEKGDMPLVSASEYNNGVLNFVESGKMLFNKKITVAGNGSVGETFYQNGNFYATSDVNILIPKFENFNPYIALFFCVIFRSEKYRYNYGRKWGKEKLKNDKIKLPVNSKGNPDFEFMENYIKSLAYSGNLD
ncbi:MAG: restriction endonuclease subunit S [Rickettsiales bacterium]|jgi:hypothetical protein|nr:restriction endonuclease subunit S [Rickettsiales bacterium]